MKEYTLYSKKKKRKHLGKTEKKKRKKNGLGFDDLRKTRLDSHPPGALWHARHTQNNAKYNLYVIPLI